MTRPVTMISVSVLLVLAVYPTMVQAQPPHSGSTRWDFELGHENDPPTGFAFSTTGEGPPGQWVVKTQPDAPSGTHVLAQVDGDPTDESRFVMAVADQPVLANVRVSVQCKPVSGTIDQACGVVFRYQDQDHYYLARANVLEDNVRLFKVEEGRRHQLVNWRGPVTRGQWHELRVDAAGERIDVFWDGQQVIGTSREMSRAPGKVGLWTKSDSVTYFDDLRVESLEPSG